MRCGSTKPKQLMDHVFDGTTYSTAPVVGTFHKIVHPLGIACRYCGAKPGEKCTKWRRAKHNRKIKVTRNPHPDRCYDAKIATKALVALNIQS